MFTNVSVRSYDGVTPNLGERVFVDPSAVVSGDVTIGDDSSVWPCTVIRGDMLPIVIGARTSVQDGSVVHCTHDGPFSPGGSPTIVGDDVVVGHSATLHGCTIGDRVLVGIGARILDDVLVESEVMIGAGTLVPPGKTLESGYLYFGNPCRQARALTRDELAYFVYTAGHYVETKNSHLREFGIEI